MASGKLVPGGGTVGSGLTRTKKRSQLNYATISAGNPLSRTQSLLTTASRRRDKKVAIQSMKFHKDDEDTLVPCDVMMISPQSSPESTPRNRSPKDIRPGTVARRKESFLRKTLRAATASNRNNNSNNSDSVTNQIVKE